MKLKQKLKKLNMGTIRVHFFRARMDLSVIQFILILYVAYNQGMSWWWCSFIPFYLWYKVHDIRTYLTQEVDYNFKKSKMTMQMYTWCKENNEMLKKMKQPTGDELVEEYHKHKN